MGYIRRTGIVECQSGSNHSHSMVSVMFLLLNLLFCFCMHLFRLGCLTVCLMDMLCWFIALNLIWLYICWHKYVRLPLCDNSKNRKSTDPSCHVSLTLALSLSLSPSLLLPRRIATLVSLVFPYQIEIFQILSLYSLLLP